MKVFIDFTGTIDNEYEYNEKQRHLGCALSETTLYYQLVIRRTALTYSMHTRNYMRLLVVQ